MEPPPPITTTTTTPVPTTTGIDVNINSVTFSSSSSLSSSAESGTNYPSHEFDGNQYQSVSTAITTEPTSSAIESTKDSKTKPTSNTGQISTNSYVGLSTTDSLVSGGKNNAVDSEENRDANIEVTSDSRIQELTTASHSGNSSNSEIPATETLTIENNDITNTSSEDVTTEEGESDVRSTVSNTDSTQPIARSKTHTTEEPARRISSSSDETPEFIYTTGSNVAYNSTTANIDTVSNKATTEKNEEKVTFTAGFGSELADVFSSTNSATVDNDTTTSTIIALTGAMTTDSWVSEIHKSIPEARNTSSLETESTTTASSVSTDETDNSQNFISTSSFDKVPNYTASLPEVSIESTWKIIVVDVL